MRFCNGDSYEGDFKRDKLHGQGLYYYSNGKVQSGNWDKGICQDAKVSKSTSTIYKSSNQHVGGMKLNGVFYDLSAYGSSPRVDVYGTEVWVNGKKIN